MPKTNFSPTRLQVVLWRAVQDEPCGPCERPVTVPKEHLEALLQYVAKLEDLRLVAVRIEGFLDKHPRPSLPNASFDEDADIYKKLKATLAASNPDGP